MASYVLSDCPECGVKEMATLLGDDRKKQVVACEKCDTEYERPSPQRFQKSLYYPHLNACLGTVVKSREHEDHVAAKMGMTRTTTGTIDGRRARVTRKKLFKPAKY